MRFKTIVVALFVISTGLAQTQTDYDAQLAKNRAMLEKLQDEIRKIKSELSQSRERESSVMQQIALIDKEMSLIARSKGLLEQKRRIIENKIAANNRKLKKTRQRLSDLKDLYARRVIYAYKYGKIRNLELILTADSFNQALIRYRYLRKIAEQDERTIHSIEEKKEKIRQLQQELREDLAEKRANIKAKEAEEEHYQSRKAQKRALLKKLQWNQDLYQKQLARKQKEKERLDNLILALERKRRYQQQSGRKDDDYVQFDYEDILKARGKLPWPVQGKIVSRYGKQHDPLSKTYIKNTDIEIQSPLGTPVKSVFSGVVRMITYLPGYGNTLIIDHGKGFYTVYSHLNEIYVKKNDIVKTGEVVATVGDSGSLEGSKLQFGIYGGQKTYDPLTWLTQ